VAFTSVNKPDGVLLVNDNLEEELMPFDYLPDRRFREGSQALLPAVCIKEWLDLLFPREGMGLSQISNKGDEGIGYGRASYTPWTGGYGYEGGDVTLSIRKTLPPWAITFRSAPKAFIIAFSPYRS
jgi:hypothetical protein